MASSPWFKRNSRRLGNRGGIVARFVKCTHRKNNHPKRAWRQVRLETEGLDWRLCGRAQTGISMVAKSWNAAQYLGLSGEQESQRVREGQHPLADGKQFSQPASV